MRRKWIFLDYAAIQNPRHHPSARVYITEAYTEDEAWQRFAKFAYKEFGLKDSSVAYVKDYFGSSIMLVKPDELVELLPKFPGS